MKNLNLAKEGGFKMKTGNLKNSLFIVSLLIASTSLSGCFKMGGLFGNGNSSGTAASAAIPTASSTDGPVPAVLAGSQTMASLSQMTGVTAPSGTTKNTFVAQAPNLSVAGDPTQIAAPWQLSHATLAAEFCNDALTQNAAKIYPGINFASGPSQWTPAAVANVASGLCRAFWRHNCTAAELSFIQADAANLVASVPTGVSATVQANTVGIGICTAMLTATSAVSH